MPFTIAPVPLRVFGKTPLPKSAPPQIRVVDARLVPVTVVHVRFAKSFVKLAPSVTPVMVGNVGSKADCTSVTFVVPKLMEPVRSKGAVLGASWKLSIPGPVPLRGGSSVMNGIVVDADHGQVAPTVLIFTVPVFAPKE